jgi:hypothetical protein
VWHLQDGIRRLVEEQEVLGLNVLRVICMAALKGVHQTSPTVETV